jgi:hypothetical protein
MAHLLFKWMMQKTGRLNAFANVVTLTLGQSSEALTQSTSKAYLGTT